MVTDNTVFDIATAPKRNSKLWERGTVTWGEIKDWCRNPGSEKEAGNYVLGILAGNRRLKSTIRSRCAVTLDADSPSEDFLASVRSNVDAAFIIHTTFSATSAKPRYRVIIPLTRKVLPQEYPIITNVLMKKIGEMSFDPGSSQAERYMFRPATQDKGSYFYEFNEGDALDPDKVISDWDGDTSKLPPPVVSRSKRDPLSLKGTPGFFNTVHTDFDELIHTFDLPYELVSPGRYRFEGADGAPGMGEIEGYPNLYYSHHSHDPAYGVAMSAFDLVRVHKFGHLDEGTKEGTPINRLPSSVSMMELASRDPGVAKLAQKTRKEQVDEDFYAVIGDDLKEEMESVEETVDPDSWKRKFILDAKTSLPTDDIRNLFLIADNDTELRGIYFNDMSLSTEAESLPWRTVEKHNRQLHDMDYSNFRSHIEMQYGIRLSQDRLMQLIARISSIRSWNPVREYLSGLHWDGVERVETCLPGVMVTDYSRMVARKMMVAAVARALDPGVKWDHMLMIYGKGGLGKSYWMQRMSKGWSENLETIGARDTYLSLARSWIVIADEGHSMKKADFDQLKEFITKTSDTFRAPYGRSMLTIPRHNVFWGTTNDHRFLQREEGNRRFLIVEAKEKYDFSKMTDEYIDQVWAEAVQLYRDGESLVLTEEELDIAEREREEYTQEDVLSGIVESYLATPVPKDWDCQNSQQHINYLESYKEGFDSGDGEITQVCAIQIWVEALGKRAGEQKTWDIAQISKSLRAMEGWIQKPGRHEISDYGRQVVFEKISDGTEFAEELSDLI